MNRPKWMLAVSLAATAACGGSQDLRALCSAVEAQDVDQATRLLQSGTVDLNADQGTTGVRCRPFPEAMEKVRPEKLTDNRRGLEIVRVMLDQRADPNSCWLQPSPTRGTTRSTSSPSTIFCVIEYAARSQSMNFVRLAIERGANAKGGAGASALSEAALLGDLEMVKTLVDAGAPLNEVAPSTGDHGSRGTALGAAVRGLHQQVIAYLEALPGAREFPAPSVLSGAASAASRVVGGQGGLTASEQAFMTAARKGDLAAVAAGLANGMQVNRLDDYGLSALMRAAAWGRMTIVDALLKAGADPKLMNGGKTALHHAAANGHAGVIRALARGKADINARASGTDDTPLGAAVKAGHAEAARALLALGADTTVADSSMTVLEYAVWRANTAVVRALVAGGRTAINARHPSAQGSPLHGALWCKNPDYNVELIRTLVAAGADLTALDRNGDTPLKAVQRKRAAETLPYYQACYDAQVVVLQSRAK